jgi:hypothetical protein
MNEQSSKINVALAAMAAQAEPGRSYSCGEISRACGCSAGLISQIELSALGKLREALKRLGLDRGELQKDD